ncbi:thioredoxin-like protein [Pluteus cervinus]|uniref:Thioredoxin-like protein n=1 Tax=Pluteus cervinus TaxID=181527 RepID=A0ACD3BE76_9AGAR|nr:thioredoxin-like protein [Pluteus cervinus]
MYADIEALVLSGELFNGGQSSPKERASTPSTDEWDEEGIEEQPSDEESGSKTIDGVPAAPSIGMGPGRTGVKGVIRDRDEAEGLKRGQAARDMDALRTRMEKSNLGGKTFLEEEREKGLDEKVDGLIEKEREKLMDKNHRRDLLGRRKEGRFGHLREVGREGFVGAVEKEEPNTWVIIHLYDPYLDRCDLIDESLARLARIHSDTKFLRVRAAALGFTARRKEPRRKKAFTYAMKPIAEEDEDPYGSDNDEKKSTGSDEEEWDDDDVDRDMLPTMLVYRGGDLVQNWVRVDEVAGSLSLEEFLENHNILPHGTAGLSFVRPSVDDDDDLFLSDG